MSTEIKPQTPPSEFYKLLDEIITNENNTRKYFDDAVQLARGLGFEDEEIANFMRDYCKDKINRVTLWRWLKPLQPTKDDNVSHETDDTEKSSRQTDENDLRRIRPQVLMRDKYQCTVCGRTDSLQIHHINKVAGLGIDHSLDNLRTLCKVCHGKQTREETADSPHRPHVDKSPEVERFNEIYPPDPDEEDEETTRKRLEKEIQRNKEADLREQEHLKRIAQLEEVEKKRAFTPATKYTPPPKEFNWPEPDNNNTFVWKDITFDTLRKDLGPLKASGNTKINVYLERVT